MQVSLEPSVALKTRLAGDRRYPGPTRGRLRHLKLGFRVHLHQIALIFLAIRDDTPVRRLRFPFVNGVRRLLLPLKVIYFALNQSLCPRSGTPSYATKFRSRHLTDSAGAATFM